MKKALSLILTIGLIFSLFVPASYALDLDNGKFEAKPLFILMDYQDYKYSDFLSKETSPIYKSDSYEKEHYFERLLSNNTYEGPNGENFISMKKYYLEESKGLYSLGGNVFGWYTAKNNAAHYGSNEGDGSDQDNASLLVQEAIDAVAAENGVSLSDYDVEDKYDFDNDGNYREPDGIIDTVIVIHAGMGEEMSSGGSLGADAIYPFNGKMTYYHPKQYEVTDTKGNTMKVEDFIVVEQDFPLGLMCHEYGHYLGLPDLYGSEEPVQAWSIMAGSYSGAVPGSLPTALGGYCKEQLQKDHGGKWQKKKTIDFDDIDEEGIDVSLEASSSQSSDLSAVRINLPNKTTVITTPVSGDSMYFSGKSDNLRNSMTTSLDLRNTQSIKLEFKTWYNIEDDFDYASIQVKEKGTDKWTAVEGNITTTSNPNDDTPDDPTDRNPGYGITGNSGEKWIDANFDLSQFAGKEIDLMFYYWTDTNTVFPGMYIDNIKIVADGKEIFFDDTEGNSNFSLNGFGKSDGISKAEHYYLLEWRNNQGVDEAMNVLPWTQTYVADAKASNDPGLLIWYIDRTWGTVERLDQNAKGHPGRVSVGVVDADQSPVEFKYKDNENEIYPDKVTFQLHDAAFSLRKGSEFLINWSKVITYDDDTSMHPIFDDSKDYSNTPHKPTSGLILENYGLKVLVTEESPDRNSAKVHIMNANNAEPQDVTPQGLSVEDLSVSNNEITLKIEGNIGDNAFIGYISEDGSNVKVVDLKLKEDKYIGTIDKNKFSGSDTWKVNFVIVEDDEGSYKAFYNSKVHSGFGTDLSMGNIEEKEVTLESISIKSNKDTIIKGTSVKLDLSGKMSDGSQASEKDLENAVWSSSKESIATVDENGKVTGIAPGKVTISANIGDIKDSINISIIEQLENVLEINIPKDSFKFHEIIKVSGKLTNNGQGVKGATLVPKANNDKGEMIFWFNESIITDADGEFSLEFTMNDKYPEGYNGSYEFVVYSHDLTPNNVTETVNFEAVKDNSNVLEINVPKEDFTFDETIKITGKLTSNGKGVAGAKLVPKGNDNEGNMIFWFNENIVTDENGEFSLEFTMKDKYPDGDSGNYEFVIYSHDLSPNNVAEKIIFKAVK